MLTVDLFSVYLLSHVDIVICYIEVDFTVWASRLCSLYRGSIPYILLLFWPGHGVSFVISRTSLNRGSLNQGSTAVLLCPVCECKQTTFNWFSQQILALGVAKFGRMLHSISGVRTPLYYDQEGPVSF